MPEQHFAPILNNMNGGEISPRMEGRTDTAIYPIALAEMINFAPSVEGPAVKIPGFRYIRAAAATSTWLSPFIFSRTQAYVLEWADGALRFYTNGGRIETAPGVAYEVAVPYSGADAPFVSSQQSYDRLYLAHRAYALASLTRLTATTFSHAAVTLEGGPFADMNRDKAVTIAFTASSGEVTGYASGGDVWLPTDAGSLFLVETRDYAEIPQWMSAIEVADGELRASDGKVYLAVGGAAVTGNVQPTHWEGAAWDGDGVGQDVNAKGPYGKQWQYVHDRFGIVRIDEVVNATKIEGTVLRRLPDSAALANSYSSPIGYDPPYSGGGGGFYEGWDVAENGGYTFEPTGDGFIPPTGTLAYDFPGTWRWAKAAISDSAGWPVAVLLAWGRLVLFTDFEIIGSAIGDYGGGRVNFAEYDESGVAAIDMSFRRRLSISNPVIWAREDRGNIIVGTQDGEYLIGPINPSQAVSAENIQSVKQTRHGAAPVFPVDAGGETFFVQRGGRKLRAASYSFADDRYLAPNVNIWSRHILKPGCVQLAFEQESEEMLWALRGDGVLACHPVNQEQEIKGFSRRAHAAGPIRSAVCVPSEDGALDELWALVEDGDGNKSVERRAPWWVDGDPAADAFFVDSGVTIESPASLTITGLGWLAGKAVGVLADGAVLRGLSVTSAGALTLPAMAQLPSKVTIGLNYSARLKSLRPELRDPRGHTVQAAMQRLFKLGLRLLETSGVRVSAKPGVEDDFIRRGVEVPMGEGAPFFSGDVIHEVGGDWDRKGQFELISDDPVPCIVVAAMPRLAVTE
jgi:hypothetical protein